jgi:hypothetical protein
MTPKVSHIPIVLYVQWQMTIEMDECNIHLIMYMLSERSRGERHPSAPLGVQNTSLGVQI